MGMYVRFVGSDLRFDAARKDELEESATEAAGYPLSLDVLSGRWCLFCELPGSWGEEQAWPSGKMGFRSMSAIDDVVALFDSGSAVAWADEDGVFAKAEKTVSGEVVRSYWEPEMDEIPFRRA